VGPKEEDLGMRTFFERAKLIAGVVFAGLGIFTLQKNLDRTAAQLCHLVSTTSREALGALPTMILGASRLAQVYAAGHQRFLEGVLHQMLVSSWPLLLVVVGAALLRDEVTDKVDTPPKKKIVHSSIEPPDVRR
jgi:hypothetical protein